MKPKIMRNKTEIKKKTEMPIDVATIASWSTFFPHVSPFFSPFASSQYSGSDWQQFGRAFPLLQKQEREEGFSSATVARRCRRQIKKRLALFF